MNSRPKTEPGSPSVASSSHGNFEEKSITELISVLRAAYLVDDFDRVEKVLVARDERLRDEIGPLLHKIEMERLERIQVQEELMKREELCERGKKVQESYETLLKEVKTNGLVDKKTIEELKNKNLELECENSKLKELKTKWVEDSNALHKLRIRVRELEDEKLDDKNVLAALKIKNNELEGVKKNLATLEELRTENHKLEDEKLRLKALVESLVRKFGELNRRVVRLEVDTKLLMSADASSRGNNKGEPPADPKVTFQVIDKEDEELNEMDVNGYEFGIDTGGPAPLQRNDDTPHSLGAGTTQFPSKAKKDALGASDGGRLVSENVIELIDLDDDDDDNRYMLPGLHGKKAISQINVKDEHPSSSDPAQQKSIFTEAQRIEMVKRKFPFQFLY
ncbi:uncharacterized protein LOC133317818 isoform X1 [Gastrolobium bilobum]|uniref:uncharacterized protein LOC133317818 isoform X1 n=1 Tax=Gastrolobium bilobum TaxID=150636 RepID=UPI002AAF59F1|nr:uncharacterized protein LOC133317818 isoform X1 [Gastrolobium bilobum]